MPIITHGLPSGGLWGYNAENRWLFLQAVCCGLCLQTNMATHFKIIKNLWYRGLKSAVSEIYKDWWLSDLKIEKPFFFIPCLSYSFTSNSGRGGMEVESSSLDPITRKVDCQVLYRHLEVWRIRFIRSISNVCLGDKLYFGRAGWGHKCRGFLQQIKINAAKMECR